jgi:hypothetical protein
MLDSDVVILPIVLLALFVISDRLLMRWRVMAQEDLSARLCGTLIFTATYVVISAWALSTVHLLIPAVWRLTTGAVLVIGTIIAGPLPDILGNNLLTDLVRAVHRRLIGLEGRILLTLSAILLIWLVFGFVRLALLPATNTDAIVVHNLMAAIWFQDGTISDFKTWGPVTFYPVNTHLLTMFQRIVARQSRSALALTMLVFAGLVNISAWTQGQTLRRAVAAVLTFAAVGVAIWIWRRAGKETLHSLWTTVLVAGFMAVIIAQYILSAIFDLRSSLSVMRAAAAMPPSERNFDNLYPVWSGGELSTGLSGWIDSTVPANAWLLIYK